MASTSFIFVPFCQSMQKGTKKIFGWLNAVRLAASLEQGAVERRRRRSRIEFFQPEFLVTFFDKKVT